MYVCEREGEHENSMKDPCATSPPQAAAHPIPSPLSPALTRHPPETAQGKAMKVSDHIWTNIQIR